MNELPGLDPTVFTHHTAQANGVQLHYVRGGQGPVLLLWHGFLGTWYCWRKIMPALAERYTVIAPDMRGYGDSDKPAEGYDARTLAEDFRALVQQLGFRQEKVVLVAHGMGAPPALVHAAEYPDEVRALVYLDEPVLTSKNLQQVHAFTPEGTHNGGLWWWALGLAGNMAERLITGHERAFLTWFYEHYLVDASAIDDTTVDEYLRTFVVPGGITGAFGVYRAIWQSVAQTEPYSLRKIAVPILGLGGEKSIGDHVPQKLTGVATNVAGGAIPDCGHLIAEERPDYSLKRLRQFLA